VVDAYLPTISCLSRKSPPDTVAESDPIQTLASAEERNIARQVADMGFPAERVVRACQALGCCSDGGARAIHFCLVAGKLADGGHEAEEVERALVEYDLDETKARTHLEAFTKIRDLG
jgi:hypothetical protein